MRARRVRARYCPSTSQRAELGSGSRGARGRVRTGTPIGSPAMLTFTFSRPRPAWDPPNTAGRVTGTLPW